MTEEIKLKLNKFFQDPDWVLVEEMINEYIDPLRNVSTVKTDNTTADAVMAEVVGRKIATEELTKFLRECRLIGKINKNIKGNFK